MFAWRRDQEGRDADALDARIAKTAAEIKAQLGRTAWLASDDYTLADAEITPYIVRADRLGLAGLWESRPRLADWFRRIKARPSFKAIADYPPADYDDTGRDGLKHWARIESSGWYGIGAPKGTPGDIVEKLNREINAVLADSTVKARLADLGGMPRPATPAEFGRFIATETEKWAKVIRVANVKVD